MENNNNDVKKEELEFVHDNDLLPVLEKLGLKDNFIAGKIKCEFCGDTITKENLHSFFENNGVRFGCNKNACIKDLENKQ